jgi:hypothetical protein
VPCPVAVLPELARSALGSGGEHHRRLSLDQQELQPFLLWM